MRYMIALFCALYLALSAHSAVAQQAALCGDRAEAVASLEKKYSEKPVSIGLASNGAVLEVFASEAGTFTIVMTYPNGISCLIVAGENWENMVGRVSGAGV
tara:strand:+ start:1171 stop:1473 length:303 start_codon:yes stop_codon:yes gene_type:complete